MEPIVAELNSAKSDATAKAIKKLQKVQVDLTKKGDLDGALATKKYIEGLQKSIKDNKELAANDLVGNPLDDAKNTIVGKWQWSEGETVVVTIKNDNTATGYGFSGKVTLMSAILTIKWDNGTIDTITLVNQKDGTFLRRNSNGLEYKAKKLD
jgi:hypothetical protein